MAVGICLIDLEGHDRHETAMCHPAAEYGSNKFKGPAAQRSSRHE